MVDVAQLAADAAPDALHTGGVGDERLPLSQAAALIVAMSLGVWGAIGAGVGWLVG